MDSYRFVPKTKRFTCCLEFIKFTPVLLVFSLICYSYYSFVLQLCFVVVDSLELRIIYLVFYHIILIMLLWSYWRTVYTKVGQVPKRYKLPDDLAEQFRTAPNEDIKLQIIERYGNELPVMSRTFIAGRPTYRYCFQCNHLKPDRCHHCRICQVCVLKMDHHCPWVNNCVSFTNYKFFMLFLFYGFVFCVYLVLTSLPYFLEIWRGWTGNSGQHVHILFLFILSAMFMCSILSLLAYHLYLIAFNRTTLEAFRAPIFENGRTDQNGFNLGLLNNFKQVLGEKYIMWPIPLFSSYGDGLTFPRLEDNHLVQRTVSSMTDDTSAYAAILGNGVSFMVSRDKPCARTLLNAMYYSDDDADDASSIEVFIA